MKALLFNLLCSGQACSFASQAGRKVVFVNAFTALGLIPLLFYGLSYAAIGHVWMAAFFFSMIVVAIANLLWLRLRQDADRAASVVLLILIVIMNVAVVRGEQYRSGPFWLASYPLVAFFVKGPRSGLAWSMALLLSLLLLTLAQALGWIDTPFTVPALALLVASMMMVTLIVYIYEKVRSQAEQDLHIADERLRQLAHYDALTGLANRSKFFDRFDWMLARARRWHASKLALLFLDLDGFKRVNDSLGHEAGDHVLVEVAARLQASVREVDIVARYGGDEFLVLIDEVTGIEDAEKLAAKLIQTLSQPYQCMGKVLNVGVSIGICLAPDQGSQPDVLINQADAYMYQAKKAGGNCFHSAYTEPQSD